eukprot:jgi/Chlat1/7585/Chrsp63S07071
MAKGGGKKKAKKRGLGVDWAKAKSKVGRKLPAANNSTDTGFKSRSLLLPSQSISKSRSLPSLLSLLSHHSALTRKEALSSLSSTLSSLNSSSTTSTTASTTMGEVACVVSERVSDVDAGVRRVAIGVMVKTVLPGVGERAMAPHMPLLALQVCGALANTAAPVRADAVTLATELLIGHFVALLTGNRTTQRSPSQLVKTAVALRRTLTALYPSATDTHMHTQTNTQQQHVAPKLMWRPQLTVTLMSMRTVPAASSSSLSEGQSVHEAESDLSSLPQQVLPVLLQCWLDSLPFALGPAPESDALRVMKEAMLTLAFLLRSRNASTLPASVQQSVQVFAVKVMGQFPLCAPHSNKFVDEIVDINMAVSEAAALLLPHISDPSQANSCASRVLYYLSSALQGVVLPAAGDLDTDTHYDIASEKFVNLMPKILQTALLVIRILPSSHPQREGFCEVFSGVWEQCGALSPALEAMLGYVSAARELVTPSVVARWVRSVPRLLWQLKGNQPARSEALLQLLLEVVRRGGDADAEPSLQSLMIPFFATIRHPTSTSSAPRPVFGPFIKLSPSCQSLALDTLYYYNSNTHNPAMLRALALCCAHASVPVASISRTLDIVISQAARIDVADLLQFVVAILFPISSVHIADITQHARRVDIVHACCSALKRLGDGVTVVRLLSSVLRVQLRTDVGMLEQYAAVAVVTACAEVNFAGREEFEAALEVDNMPSVLAACAIAQQQQQQQQQKQEGPSQSANKLLLALSTLRACPGYLAGFISSLLESVEANTGLASPTLGVVYSLASDVGLRGLLIAVEEELRALVSALRRCRADVGLDYSRRIEQLEVLLDSLLGWSGGQR